MRLAPPILACLLLAACAPRPETATEPSAEETRLLALLARDPYVVIERTERDYDGNLLVLTQQGARSVRYLIAPDDPARPDLRLRPLADACTLETAPNPTPGGGPVPR